MIGLHPDCPPSVTLLADHLDAALAVGEDLLAATLPPRSDLDELDPQAAPDVLDDWVRRLMQLESSLLLRVLQARRLANDCPRNDAPMRAAVALFKAQTEALHELILRAGREEQGLLARAGDSHAYFRSRGLIPPEAAAPSPFERLVVGEAFRIGGIAPLGHMLDLVSALLDFLDARYGLYSPAASVEVPVEEASAPPAASVEGQPAFATAGEAAGEVVKAESASFGPDLVRDLDAAAAEASTGHPDDTGGSPRVAEDGAAMGADDAAVDCEQSVLAVSKSPSAAEGASQPAV